MYIKYTNPMGNPIRNLYIVAFHISRPRCAEKRRVALGRREDRGLVAKVIRDKALSKYAKFSDHSAWRFVGGWWLWFGFFGDGGRSGGGRKNPKSFVGG